MWSMTECTGNQSVADLRGEVSLVSNPLFARYSYTLMTGSITSGTISGRNIVQVV